MLEWIIIWGFAAIVPYIIIGLDAWNNSYWNFLYIPFLPQIVIWENDNVNKILSKVEIIVLEILLSILLLPITLLLVAIFIPVTFIVILINLFCHIFRRNK